MCKGGMVRGLTSLRIACAVIILFPALLSTLYIVEGRFLLSALGMLPTVTLTVLSLVTLVLHLKGEKTMPELSDTVRLRFRLLFQIVMFLVLFISEGAVDRMFREFSTVYLGLSELDAHLIAVQSKLLWFVGVLLSLWVLINASCGVESIHQFKAGLANHNVSLMGDLGGADALKVTFEGSVKPHELRLDCDIPAYYSGVTVLFIMYSILAQCVSVIMGEPLITGVFGFVSVVLIVFLRDLGILRSQKIVYEYIASEQNKLSVKQVGKNEGVDHA